MIPSLKYYFRLINRIDDFIEIYSKLIQDDKELKTVHKLNWNQLMQEMNNEI